MDYFDRKFMEICSQKTLQSNNKGFFLDFVDNLIENIDRNVIKANFNHTKSDLERIRAVYENESIGNYVCDFLSHVQEVYRKKSGQASLERLQAAENCLKHGDYLKASTLYSQAVLKAPKTGPELALSLYGRSQILIVQRQFSAALNDIQLALKLDLPEKFKIEAFTRMILCYKNLNETDKARIAFDIVKKMKINEQQSRKLREILDATTSIIDDSRVDSRDGVVVNEIYSDKITVKQSRQFGRYAVANDDIRSGETLIVEKPYVACLLPEKFGTHCHHCFGRLLAPIGCPDCSSIAFCTINCRDIALNTYHRYECKFLDLLIGSGMSILSHSALRMITQNTLDKNLQIYKDRSKLPVYKLCTNSEKRSTEDFFQRTLMAAFLLRILQKSEYFGKNSSITPTEIEYKIAELILQHLQILQFNAHEIYETLHDEKHRLKGAIPSYIGVALYPSVALLNHGCYQAVTRYFLGKNIVINTVRPLKRGDVIEENYGPTFTWRTLPERQRILSGRYWFQCECQACRENWPKLDQGLESRPARIRYWKMLACVRKSISRCPNLKCSNLFTLPVKAAILKCPSCKKHVNLDGNIEKFKLCLDQYQKGLDFVDNEEIDKAIETICSALDVFHRVSAAPHRETHLAQEALRLCLADSGNRFLCPKIIK